MADIERNDMEEEDGVIELLDEENNVIKFKLVDVTEYKGAKYAFLIPAEANDAVEEDEIAVFLFNEEEQVLETIEDEALMQEVFDFWQFEDDAEEEGD